MKRYQRYSKYWYPHLITLIRLYPDKLGDTPKGKEAEKAISEALVDTMMMDQGKERVKAINSIYFEDRKTAGGVAYDQYVSQRTVEGWIHDFVYMVAKNLNYIN